MRAVVLHGREQLSVEDVPERALESGEVRVKIEAALTCGTDLKVYKRGYHARMIQPPAVFGHELAGVITEAARDAGEWRAGDRVIVANSAPCGQCPFCAYGQENLCDDLLFLNGAYAESIVVPRRVVEKNVVKLSAGTTFRDAALAEPLACVVLGIEEANLQPGMRTLVIGAGPIGLMFVALAASMSCEVTIAGRGKNRLETGQRLGAKRVLDISDATDLAQTIQSRASGPFDVVIEAVGKPETWSAAVQLARKGGRVNLFGGCPSGTTVPLDTTRMHYSSLTLVSSFHHTPRTFRRALEFIERGVVRASEFVDGECALSLLPELFRSMAAGNKAVKYFVDVSS
jgi:L-iditol 2-dehydrogenase